MSWPTVNPVWQFCWVRPTGSSGANGSGLEIRHAYYNGHLVLKRGGVPILNVKYDPGGCGGPSLCYRDWLTTEHSYLSDNVISTGYAEPTCPPVTVCDDPTGVDTCDIVPPPPDCTRTCFQGVSAEKLADRLILTSQNEAGWYRYTMKWTFYLDGRIQPTFGFTAVSDPCINHTHRHHAYWRFDFDIDGPDGDVVTEGPNPGGAPGRPGPRPPSVVLSTEAMRRNNRPNLTWSVVDSTTKRGYRVVPGDETELPADSFSVGDVWLLELRPERDRRHGPERPRLRGQDRQLRQRRVARERPRLLVSHGRAARRRRPRPLPRGRADAGAGRRLVSVDDVSRKP